MAERITFKCIDCGAPVVIDQDNPPNDETVLSCQQCGRVFGSYAEVRQAIVEAGKKSINDAVDGAGLPGWIKRS